MSTNFNEANEKDFEKIMEVINKAKMDYEMKSNALG